MCRCGHIGTCLVNVGLSHPQRSVDTDQVFHHSQNCLAAVVGNCHDFLSFWERLWTRSKTERSLRMIRLTFSTEWMTVV